MEETTVTELLEGLESEDVATRALTMQRVRQVDLDSMPLLDRVLELCNDDTPLPDSMQPPEPEDPFAEFFGDNKAAAAKVPVAQKAAERLVFTGVIGKPETAEHIAAALDAAPPTAHFVKAATKVLAETVWSDRLGAVKALIPALHRSDASLYEVVVRMGENEHRVMIRSALDPYNSRAVNELLNHGPAKALMEDALAEAIVGGHLDLAEPDAADALTLLVSWASRQAARVAAALEPRYPWAILVRGLDDASAGDALRSWLQTGAPAPAGLVRKLAEALKSRPDSSHFPLDAWLEYSGSGVELVRQWGATERCQAQLIGFVESWQSRAEHPQRAWEAIDALVEAGLHAPIVDAVLQGLADDAQQGFWGRSRFGLLVRANPPIPGLLGALGALVIRHPTATPMVVPALMERFSATEIRPLVESVITLAESRPIIRKPSQRGLVHEEREGVATAPLQRIVSQLDDPALQARLQAVLPYVRAE